MQPKLGNLYVIDCGDMKTFKIGYTTKDVSERLRQISKSSVLMPYKMSVVMSFEVLTNVSAVESLMHLKFEGHRVNGEWFNLSFVDLVELYQAMWGLSCRKTLHRRWFEIVPEDHKKYIEYGVIDGSVLPFMSASEYSNHLKELAIVPDFSVFKVATL